MGAVDPRWVRLILGAVYTGMAAGQAISWPQMPGILAAYQVGGPVAMRVLAVALLAGELVCGLWLLLRPRSRALTPVWIYIGVGVVWAVLGAQAFARGLAVPNCGCFGQYLSQRLSWFVLAQDALLLGYAALMLRATRTRPVTPPLAGARDPNLHADTTQGRPDEQAGSIRRCGAQD